MHTLIYRKVDEKSAGIFKTEQNFISASNYSTVSASNYSTVSPRIVNVEMKKLEKWMKDKRERYTE